MTTADKIPSLEWIPYILGYMVLDDEQIVTVIFKLFFFDV